MTSDNPDKRAVVVITTTIAVLVAMVFALVPPVSYFGASYAATRGEINAEAQINSRLVAHLIDQNSAHWQLQEDHLIVLLSRRADERIAEIRRIVGAQGQIIAENADPIGTLVTSTRIPIYDSGIAIGYLEVSRSLVPILRNTSWIALLSFCVSLLAYYGLRNLPLRALKQAIQEVAAAKDEARVNLEGLVKMRTAELQAANTALLAEKVHQEELNKKLAETHTQLLQSEKMAAIGQLAAGVAHEINNPVGFVNSNLGTMQRYVNDLLEVLSAYERGEGELRDETRSVVTDLKQRVDLAYTRDDIGKLLTESMDGLRRVRVIVQDLKDFSHINKAEWQQADLHRGLNSTLNVVNNEIKYKAKVVKEYGELPEIECLPSQLNQVFMNLLVNAAHAIAEHGTITLRTGRKGDEVWVEVADTGSGITPENRTRIFEPFFTTKPVGEGTGLGLSLSYAIVQKHHGRIDLASTVGEGTTFRIWLPLKQPVAAA